MEDEDIICANSNNNDDYTHVNIREIRYTECIIINNHCNRNAHQHIKKTYESQKYALHMEAHVTETCKEHHDNIFEISVCNIPSFCLLIVPGESNCFKIFAVFGELLSEF